MNRTIIVAALAAASALAAEREARACGGCFHPPTQTVSDITDERMLLATSTTQSTLYDQIQYSGSPSSFAWVLPIQGTVTVGLSADVLFDSIDTLTATQIVPPESTCPAPCNTGGSLSGSFSGTASGASGSTATVTVTKQENVGPYATVQLHSTDGSALNDWLAQNGYQVPSDVAPVITEYVNEGFDFLALKLLPNQGVQAMRPVRVTTPGSNLSLPLRMASVGTGDTVGITIWVVSDGRYEPQNFPFFHIDDSSLVWDWSQNISNYTTLRAQDEAALDNGGWEIESSITLNQTTITNLILSGGQYYSYGGSAGTAVGSLTTTPSDPSIDYLPVGNPDAGPDAGETAAQVRDDDITTLFVGLSGPNVRVTRIRSDIAHSAMTKDFVLQASSDQSELSNVRDVTQSINEICPPQPSCGGTSGVSFSGTSGSSGASAGISSSGTSGTSSGSAGIGSAGAVADGGSALGSAPSSSSNSSWGCRAAPSSTAGGPASAGGLAALVALVASRVVRRRRSRTRRHLGGSGAAEADVGRPIGR
jgi:hypothetical protein